MESIWDSFVWLIGGGGQEYKDISAGQVAARAAIIYVIALVLIKIGKRRFMGDYSAFDILLGFIVGSIMGRGLTGAISLVNMVVVVGVLLGFHWLMATVAYYWPAFEKVIEDRPRELIIDGEVQEDAAEKSKLTDEDIKQALREEGGVETPEEVKTAYLERDGSVTVIPKKDDDE
ncbi:MAG: DUF421 domain-containing protein [Blastocatellia bacterium]|nr:DUF421 domain-containing protein [Blastocatellia bacterium]